MSAELWDEINRLRTEDTAHKVALGKVEPAIHRLDKEVFGNGSPGLAKKVSAMNVKLSFGIWLLGALVALNGTAIVAILTK